MRPLKLGDRFELLRDVTLTPGGRRPWVATAGSKGTVADEQ